jgi:DNA-binding NarL/FixJ family response regulator
MTIRVVIADDQQLVRDGLRMILDAQPDIDVVGEAADGVEAVEVVRREIPNVALMDVRMPRLDGIDATRAITTDQRLLPTRVLMLTTYDLDEHVYQALRAGAAGFLLKDMPRAQLLQAVRHASEGDAILAPAVTHRLIERFCTPATADRRVTETLTPCEAEVLQHVAAGRTNAEIALALHLGETTVKTHVARILAKLDLRDRVQAVVYAYESGFVTPASHQGGAAHDPA